MLGSQGKGQETWVQVQAAFAGGIKYRQQNLARLVRGGIRSKTETYSCSQGTHWTAKNNWRYFQSDWGVGEITKSPTSCCSAGQAGSVDAQSRAWLSCPWQSCSGIADGLQRGFSHFGEQGSQNKQIYVRAWRKHFTGSTTQGIFPHMEFPAAFFICCYFLSELHKSHSF